MMPKSAKVKPTQAQSELVGLSGSYLHMRNVPPAHSIRIDRQLGRSIAQSVQGWKQPPANDDAETARVFDEVINSGALQEEARDALEDEESPFASGRSTDSTAMGPASGFMSSYGPDGSFPETSHPPHDLLFPWNVSSLAPPHVIPRPISTQKQQTPVPAPISTAAATPVPAAARPPPTAAKSQPAPALSPSTSVSVSAYRQAASPSVSASGSPAVDSTPQPEGRTSRAPRGKRRIALDAPIQPRMYHGPSRTSLRTLPRGFEKNLEPEKIAGFRRALEAAEEGAADDDDHELIENVTTKVMQKRVKNTLAARKSRARRAEYMDQLERKLAEKDLRVEELERELREKDTELRVLKGLMYEEEEMEDEA